MASTPRKIPGADVLLKLKDSAGVATAVAGQQGSTINLSADTIDVTDKTSGNFKTYLAGLLDWSIDQDVFYTVGDASNKLLLEAYLARKAVDIEIVIGDGTEIGTTTFTGSAFITDFSIDLSLDDAASISMSLSGASALEVAIKADTP